jgi:hypothetical protein
MSIQRGAGGTYGMPCFLDRDMFVVAYLHVPYTRKERFRHVSNRSRHMRCPKEEGNVQGDDCGSIHTRPKLKLLLLSIFHITRSFSRLLTFLDYFVKVIPSAKIIYFPPLISWRFISKCSWWKLTSSKDVSRDNRKQLHSRKRRIISKSAQLELLSGSSR